MTASDWNQIIILAILFIILTPLLGKFLANVFEGRKTFLHPALSWLENLTYTISGIKPGLEMTWTKYAKAWLIFNFVGLILLILIQMIQNYLPFNPQGFPGVPLALAFNTAASFVTNTNWQSYTPESTLSYFTQMAGLAVQNFVSAAVGFCPLIALARGIARRSSETIGNFWADTVRAIVYVLLPLSIIISIFLISQGVVQSFSSYVEVNTLENAKQTIPLGPAASQIAIKQLGTNGGGFFNANSAHPFENPTALSNLLEMLLLILIPAAEVYMFGIMVGYKKHAWLLYLVMFTLWVVGIAIAIKSEHTFNPALDVYPILEGKETRLGTTNSLLWAVTTTGTANGSVNAMLSSLSPLAGGVSMFNLMIGELIYGGIGVGLCSMLMLTLFTVFLSGLMVGRTPEYLGKKIEKTEIQWVVLGVLYQGALILVGAGISSVIPAGLSSLGNQGPHGLSEILYAFSSATANNGSAFAGLNANTDYYNIVLGFVMIAGRVSIVLPSIALGGLLAKQKFTPPSLGTFSTESPLFFILLLGVIFVVSALTFFIALILGPVMEQLLMLKGKTF